MTSVPDYVELRCRSAFSFLAGASLPEDLVERAAVLGYDTLALADARGVGRAPRGSARPGRGGGAGRGRRQPLAPGRGARRLPEPLPAPHRGRARAREG